MALDRASVMKYIVEFGSIAARDGIHLEPVSKTFRVDALSPLHAACSAAYLLGTEDGKVTDWVNSLARSVLRGECYITVSSETERLERVVVKKAIRFTMLPDESTETVSIGGK